MANFDPTATAARRAGLRQRRLARRSRARQPGQEQLRAAHRRDLPASTSARILRGGYGMFYNQFDRIGSEDQLALNPPGLRNIQVNSRRATPTPVFLMKDGFPPNFLDPSNLVIRNLKLRAAIAGCAANDGAAVRRAASSGSSARNFVVSADAVGSFTSTPRGAAQPQPAAARHARCQRRRAVSRTSATSSAREMTGEANYKGVDFSFEKRFSDGYSYRASYTIGEARDQAPEHLNASSGRAAEHARPRVVGRAERLRHPSSLRRQLHRRAAVRRGQADAAGRRRPARFSAAGW